MIKNIFKKIITHKIISGIVIISLTSGGYYVSKKITGSTPIVRYTLAAITKGNLIVTKSGTGQVAVSNQIDLKPKVSGDVLSVKVKKGQEVKVGDVLVEIDSIDAKKSLRDAKNNLDTALLSLEKLQSPPDKLSLIQSENSLNQAKRNLADLKAGPDAYELMQSENALKQTQRDLEELLAPPDADAISQAENALTSAKDTLTKSKLTQETDYQKAVESKKSADDDLAKSYEDAFNTISNAFLDLPTINTASRDILYSYAIAQSESGVPDYLDNNTALLTDVHSDLTYADNLDKYVTTAKSSYTTSNAKFETNFTNYKNASRYSEKAVIEQLGEETLATTKAVAETLKNEINVLNYWADYRTKNSLTVYSQVTQYQTNLSSYTSKINNYLSSILTALNNIDNYKQAQLNAQRDIEEMDQNNPLNLAQAENSVQEKDEALKKLQAGATAQEIETANEKVQEKQESLNRLKAGATKDELAAAEESVQEREQSLANLKAGPDAIELRSQKLTVQQKQEAVADAQEQLARYTIKAPIDGIIASVDVKKGDAASSGTALLSIITKQKIAEISFNEIDIAQIKVGQKANITFDAVENLNITGEVIELDTLGTVTQGVVTYNVQIGFDVQDERVKPGMSLSANIITENKSDVLLVANSAIKTQGDVSYVEVVDGVTAGTDTSLPDLATNISSSSLRSQVIEVGISNDSLSEVTSGLSEGDVIVAQTVTLSATASSTTSTSQFRIPGLGGMGGGGAPPGEERRSSSSSTSNR